jgi:O-antigen/teichoic acid export membrane protein
LLTDPDLQTPLLQIAVAFAVTGLIGLTVRRWLAWNSVDGRGRQRWNPTAARRLLATGGLVTLASLADFLYAPIDYVILNRLVDPLAPAVYGAAVQVDAAILILTVAIATVALPNAARLHAAGDHTGVRRAYVRGSLLAAGVASGAGLIAWLVAPLAFELWLGSAVPASVAILPWVLVHTVLGSAAGVGRATLIGIGRTGTYALIVLLGGLLNVGLSLLFVAMGMGIRGVILGTILSVAARCLVAMPWLVWRSTRVGSWS